MPKKATPKTPSTSSSKPQDQLNKFVTGVVEWVDPSTLQDNPANWRTHPPEQLEALSQSFLVVAQVSPVLLNIQTGRLIDGHGRKEAAIRDNLPLALLRVNVTPEQEEHLLATLDPIAQMAGLKTSKLHDLTKKQDHWLGGLKTKRKDALQSLNKGLNSLATLASVGKSELNVFKQVEKLEKRKEVRKKDSEELSQLPLVETTDIDLPCDEEWGIPLLNEEGPFCGEVPDKVWARNTAVSAERGQTDSPLWVCVSTRPFLGLPRPDQGPAHVLGFFTEDNRFNAAYDDPVAYGKWLSSLGFYAAAEPDYSIYEADSRGGGFPFARSIWALYKSRWCAAFWQSLNIPVLPQLRWSSNDYLYSAMTDTLPKGLPWVVVHARASLASRPVAEIQAAGQGLKEAVLSTEPQGIVFYGDPKLQQWAEDYLPQKNKPQIKFIEDYANARGKELRK